MAKIEGDILLSFISSGTKESIERDKILSIKNTEIADEETSGWHQTNESVTYYLIKYLLEKKRKLSKIFLVVSKAANSPAYGGTKTPLEYYKENINKKLSGIIDTTELFEEIPYYEENDLQQSIMDIANIANTIEIYCRENLNRVDRVNIHADMTGGFRHVSMMMLSVMQLLTRHKSYDKFLSGKVIYANYSNNIIKIDDATEIYRTMQLISGADELANFGSVGQLKKYINEYTENYYKNVGNRKHNHRTKEDDWIDACKKMMSSLENFCGNLKLCKSGVIEEDIDKLRKAFYEFDAKIEGCSIIPINLFTQLLEQVRKDYENILKDDTDILDVIEWCLDKDYLQQAVTLCTEITPKYIVNKKILYSENIVIDMICRTYLVNSQRIKLENIEDEDIAKTLLNSLIYIVVPNIKNETFGDAYRTLMKEGVLLTRLSDYDRVLNIIFKYKNICEKRNDINHANRKADEAPNINTIKKKVKEYISLLRSEVKNINKV